MRDDLHGAAEISALALTAQDAPVDLARRHGAARGQALVREALIVAEVKVGLRAVLRDINLAVLIGAHGAGVHVDIGIKFLDGHGQPARFNSAPMEAAESPLPREERTPPVMKINLVFMKTSSYDFPAVTEGIQCTKLALKQDTSEKERTRTQKSPPERVDMRLVL